MGLQINFPDRTNGTCENAYIIVNMILSNVFKTGQLEICAWKNKDSRDIGKQRIENKTIPIRNMEILDEDECVTQLDFDDFAWKTGEEIYTKMKTLKVRVDGEIIDLSEASDV